MTVRAAWIAGLGLLAASRTAAADEAAWPAAIIARPYVMASEGLAVYGDFVIDHFAVGMMPVSGTSQGLHAGAAYSVTDAAALGIEYAMPFAGDTATKGEGPLVPFVMYSLAHDDRWSASASADFTEDFSSSTNQERVVHVGVAARYRVASTLAVFTGAPMGPGPVGQQLLIGVQHGGPITFTAPLGLAWQATPVAFVYARTELFAVALHNTPFADTSTMPPGTKRFVVLGDSNVGVPLELGGWGALSGHLDVGAVLRDDLRHPGDKYAVAFGLRWFK